MVGNTFCRAREEGDAVVFAGLRPGEEGAILSYFDWDRDYRAARELLCRNPVLRRAVAFAPGIRLLRQSWEGLAWDAGTGRFLRKGSLDGGAYFIAEREAESAALLDLKLKGVVGI